MESDSSNQEFPQINSLQIYNTQHIKDYSYSLNSDSYRPVEKFFGPENSFVTVATSYGNEWNGGEQIVIESYQQNGEIIWSKTISDRPYYVVNSAITNDKGDVYISGSRSLEGDLPKTNEVFGENSVEHFVAKINAEGDYEWVTEFDSENLEINSTNWTAGDIERTIDGDIVTFIEKGNQSHAIAKLNDAGGIIWEKELNTYDITNGEFIDSDNEGNIYIGWNKSVNGSYDNSIVKINDRGEELWTTTIGGNRTDYMRSILYDDNHLYVSGITDSDDFAENKDNTLWQNYVAQIKNSGSLNWIAPIQANSVSNEALKPLEGQDIAFVGIKSNNFVDGTLNPWDESYDTLFVATISESGNHELFEFSPNPGISLYDSSPYEFSIDLSSDSSALISGENNLYIHSLYAEEESRMFIFDNSYYKVVSTAQEAYDLGGYLAKPDSEEENNFLVDSFFNHSEHKRPGDIHLALGGKVKNGSDIVWTNSIFTVSSDLEAIKDEKFVNFRSDFTPNSADPFSTIYIDETGKWSAANSNSDKIRSLDSIAEVPFLSFEDSAYVLVQGPEWGQASNNALQLGGHLAVINSKEENTTIKNWLQERVPHHQVRGDKRSDLATFWIGLKADTDEYEWVNDEELTFQNWRNSSEPGSGPNSAPLGIINGVEIPPSTLQGLSHGAIQAFDYLHKGRDQTYAGEWSDYVAGATSLYGYPGIAEIPLKTFLGSSYYEKPELSLEYKVQSSAGELLKQFAVIGDGSKHLESIDLILEAESLGYYSHKYSLESTDVTIAFDPRIFGSIDASDITISGSLPIANAVQIDNEAGTIRIAAASLADLNQGSGISASTPLASINLDFDEEQIKLLEKNEDGSLKINPLSFQITANDQETVFSKTFTDDSGLTNREIVSLADLGGGFEVTGQDVTLYEAKVNLAQQGDGLVLGTQRVIGSDASITNLVRSGDTLTTSAEWLNVGNIQANNLSYEGLYNQNATLVSADFSQSSITSGSFIDGVFVKDARESTVLTTDIKITGAAGNVVDLADGIVSVKADAEGSDSFSNAGKGSSNLITFQGDLNYDGRVSMKDLAYLNAGAARQQLVESTDESGNAVQVASEASYARDVDADFSGKIDLADLSVLDADWGKTLHTGDEQFQGSADVSWSELDSQGTSSTWENDSFKDQNAIEAEDSYVGSLESPTAAGVIGADANTTANDNDITGTEFQDQIPA